MKHLVIIHRQINIIPLYSFFKELANQGMSLTLYSDDAILAAQLRELGAEIASQRRLFDFFSIIARIISIAKKGGEPQVLCFDRKSENFFIFSATIMKIRMLVFRNPDGEKSSWSTGIFQKFFSRWGNYWVLDEAEKERLAVAVSKKAIISILPLGIRSEANEQDDIFCRLANAQRENSNKKFFSVGAAAFDDDNYLENLLNAAKNCLNVIKELQLIIISDRESKNKMHWLAKKLGIDPLVWFVSQETMKRRWCSNLDIYLCPDRHLSLFSYYHVLSAQSNRLPIIAPKSKDTLSFLKEDQNSLLIEMNQSENISQAIIALYRDRIRAKEIGENGFLSVRDEFSLRRMIERFEMIFDLIK